MHHRRGFELKAMVKLTRKTLSMMTSAIGSRARCLSSRSSWRNSATFDSKRLNKWLVSMMDTSRKNTVDMEQLQAIVQHQQDDIMQLKQLYENVRKDQSTANQSIVEIQTTQKDLTSSTAGPAPLPAVPVELRTTFAMGNLGPPAEAEEIESRAKKVVSDMRAQGVEGLRAYRRRNGNVCEVIVNYPANGAIIKTKVFNSRLNLGLAIGKSVWFDIAKTRDEMRPAILTHRGAAQLESLECSREDKIEVKKTIGSRQVHLGLMLAGWVSAGQWEWANFAKSRYNAEELQSSKDSINSF